MFQVVIVANHRVVDKKEGPRLPFTPVLRSVQVHYRPICAQDERPWQAFFPACTKEIENLLPIPKIYRLKGPGKVLITHKKRLL